MVQDQESRETLLIRDLVEAPDIRTVIQIEDLTDPGLRRLILDTFVVTGEVLESLKAVLKGLSDLEGRGIFSAASSATWILISSIACETSPREPFSFFLPTTGLWKTPVSTTATSTQRIVSSMAEIRLSR